MRFFVTEYNANFRVRAPLRWHRHPGSMLHNWLKVALGRVDDQVRALLLAPIVPDPSPYFTLRAGDTAPAVLFPILPHPGVGPRGTLAPGELLEIRLRRLGRAGRHVDQCVLDGLEHIHEDLVAEEIGRHGPREREIEVRDQTARHDHMSLRFVTPTHVQVDGRFCPAPEFSTLVDNVRRRLEAICALHGELSAGASERFREMRALAAEVRCTRSQLRCEEWRRKARSVASPRGHKMVGLLGELGFEGPLGPFVGTLAAAEVIHVGKQTSMGFGRIVSSFGHRE